MDGSNVNRLERVKRNSNEDAKVTANDLKITGLMSYEPWDFQQSRMQRML